MDKVENWVTWGILLYIAFRASQPATVAQCEVEESATGWGVTDALQSQGLSGLNQGGCACQ